MAQVDDFSDPIAVIGIGCRLPGGVTGQRSLWAMLCDGVDAIATVPSDRWDADRYYSPTTTPGRMSSREGGFIDEVNRFDAEFFGISRRVAEQMDPQQRLLLEVAWEAFEDAGIVPTRRIGVFIGACSQDYGGIQSAPSQLAGMGAHTATGTFMSILANRLSYTFDLHGPSMTIDTACSSSLVAAHLACQSLRQGDSDIALVGGVNLMLTPQFPIALSQASMLSPNGRSRAFDAAADGYVRGEGAGVVVLKPLRLAMLDQDRIYAVLRGSSVNQDGNTRGITVPSGDAQGRNFRAALAAARTAPYDVGYIEAHGTGTPVGDPIEANALGRVISSGRDGHQVAYLGSIKTNIGHLEAGAGIAGLIKAVLSVYHRWIPPSLHFQTPNPEIDFAAMRLAVATEGRPWPDRYPLAVASVNSFGFGGTNANVVLTEHSGGCASPPVESTVEQRRQPAVLVFSAQNEPALRRLASDYADLLTTGTVELDRLEACLALRRAHHGHRLAISARHAADAEAVLREFAEHGSAANAVTGATRGAAGSKVAFVFNGQGPQWFAMGRTLLETSDIFREKILQCDRIARRYLDWSIHAELTAPDEASSNVRKTYCLQPTMFALQVALVELWKSWGVVPDGFAGHSMGEIAAAHASGALDLDDALRVICRRARIQEMADPCGGMMFVTLPESDAVKLTGEHEGRLWLSAVNSPRATTLSGPRDLLSRLEGELTEKGVFARLLKVNCACHSPDMEPLRDELLDALGEIGCRETTTPLYSTVTATRIAGTQLTADYWYRNFREPVRFAPTIAAMLADGYDTFIELSPHPVLSNSLKEIVHETGGSAVLASSLARDKDDWNCLFTAFGLLYVNGRDIAWERRYPHGTPMLDLPGNPWVRELFWNEGKASHDERTGEQAHPMVKRVDGPRPSWEIRWNDHRLAWVKDHDVLGSVIVPGAAYVEAALAAARELTGEPCVLEYVEFERPCVLDPDTEQLSRLELDPFTGTFEFHHRAVLGDTWQRNAHGRYHRARLGDHEPEVVDVAAVRQRCTSVHNPIDVYDAFRRKGYRYGPAFCGITELRIGPDEILAKVDVPRVLARSGTGYLFHPAVLDACLQASILHPGEGAPNELLPFTYLPTSIDQVRVLGDVTTPMWCHARVHRSDAAGLSVDIRVLDQGGRSILELSPLRGKLVPRSESATGDHLTRHLIRPVWRPSSAHAGCPPSRSAVTVTPSDLRTGVLAECTALSERLDRRTYTAGYQVGLRRLCSAYVIDALRALGCPLRAGDLLTTHDVGVLPRFERVLTRMVELLADEGVLSGQDGKLRVERATEPDAEQYCAELMTRYPACVWELRLLRRTGTRLADVLAGRVDPLELLFPGGAQDDVDAIYHSSPIARFYNSLLRKAVDELGRTADPRRTLRVLEVGGGTGGLTANVLPVLPADRCDYVFSDVSEAFVQAARDRFQDYGFVRCRTLDLEKDLVDQGIEAGTFDLVLAADVLHATTDLKGTLSSIREVLAPGGVLAMLEAAPGSPWLDLTFGLTAGWWLFRDLRLRPHGPLLPARDWTDLLAATGYTDPVGLGDPGYDGPGSQTVLVAAAPAASERFRPAPGPDESGRLGVWALAGDIGTAGRALADRITEHGGTAVLVPPGDHSALLADDLTGVVYFGGGHRVSEATTADRLGKDAQRACLGLAELMRTLGKRNAAAVWPRCYVMTFGAQPFREPDTSLDTAPLWGMGLVAGLEVPQSRCTMIDLPADPATDDVDAVWAELLQGGTEREIAIRGGERFVRRLVPLPVREVNTTVDARTLPPDTGFRLEIDEPGALDRLHYRSSVRIAPREGEVEVRVIAAGINFLDVMMALGQIPPLDSAERPLFGAECAGIVVEVGAGVTGLAPGDPVIAISAEQGTVGSTITLNSSLVVPKPANLGLEEAATIPVVFLTAWHALRKLARLRAGERVLIHSAAGGTGLAALQIARAGGAEVLATAGTAAKRDFLRSLGVRHVMDSRSGAFAEQVRRATAGAGVDVVLSAATGELMERSVACLAPYGRFVEIGKRDLMNDRPLGLRPFLQNLSYFSFDLRQRIADRPDEIGTELARLVKLFERQVLRPLPFRPYHPAHVVPALRNLAAGRHIGKIVVAMDEQGVQLTPTRRNPAGAPGTWLITGGLGGFGLTMAEALAAAGVTDLVLIGRSGPRDEQARTRIDDLRERGVRVLTESVDVTSRTALSRLLATIDRTLPPLRGVLHCAMVLDDGVITGLAASSLDRVFAPKLLGAWHLHQLTRHRALDAFVLFSSAASLIGNVGQSAYAAANTFLDHLAAVRARSGLPGLAVNWGAVSDAGYVAAHEAVRAAVAATGMTAFTAREAFTALSAIWCGTQPQVGVLPMDWPAFFRHHGVAPAELPRYAELVADAGDVQRVVEGGRLGEQVRALTGEPQRELLVERLRARVATVLGLPVAKLDTGLPLMDYLDSLLAVEISSWLEREVDVKVTIVELMQGPSVDQLADQLLVRIGGHPAASSADEVAS